MGARADAAMRPAACVPARLCAGHGPRGGTWEAERAAAAALRHSWALMSTLPAEEPRGRCRAPTPFV